MGFSPLDLLNPLGALSSIAGDWANYKIGVENLQLQKDTFNYQKDLQNRLFQREDSAVQRRAADLKAAGMSPILAAGNGAQAGPVVTVSAPQREPINLRSPQQVADLMGSMLRNENVRANNKLMELQAFTELAKQNNIAADTVLKELNQEAIEIGNDSSQYDLDVKKTIPPWLQKTWSFFEGILPGLSRFVTPRKGLSNNQAGKVMEKQLKRCYERSEVI